MQEIEKILVFNYFEEEIRVALLENYKLSEIFFEDLEADKNSGKIFIGRIENEVPSLEAFFVNIGMKKNGFLRYKDVLGMPHLYKRGDMVIVQVRKDGNARKGPQLSMQINLPGKNIVYMPYGESSIGVSRKISSSSERERLRNIAEDLIYDKEGVIFRTNCSGIEQEMLEEELKELRKKWHKIAIIFKNANKPELILSEEDFVGYILRERVDNNVKRIVVDEVNLYNKIREILEEFEGSQIVELCKKDSFTYMNIYNQMEDLFSKKIELNSGGVITIDKAEALTIIDVDSASNIKGKNVEETSIKTNSEAAVEIMRNIRLRNISGIIIIDFIDMNKKENKIKILNIINEEVKKDKARITVVGFTQLGLLEMTRKRTSSSIDGMVFNPCPICHGTGRVASPSIIFNRMMKDIEDSLNDLKEYEIKQVLVNIYHNLSGYVTPEIRKKINEKTGVEVKFEFNWNDPNSYNIRFKKE